MTKPANFPARRMQRQLGALVRLETRLRPKLNAGHTLRTVDQMELDALSRACGDIEAARAVRTKKDRTDRAKLRRA